MNLLLDTHVALWAITDHPKLSQSARELILSPKSTVWVSVASVWEIAIKHSLGRGDMPVSSQDAEGRAGDVGLLHRSHERLGDGAEFRGGIRREDARHRHRGRRRAAARGVG